MVIGLAALTPPWGTTSSWAGLPEATQRLLTAYFDGDDHGRAVRQAAGANQDYAVWFTAASAEFTVRCGQFPTTLGERRWRERYDEGRSPKAAAQLDLHRRPMVLVNEDEELVCPICDTVGHVREEDRATRVHDLSVHGDEIVPSEDDHLFEHVRYFCGSCDTTVQLPLPFEAC